MKPKAPTGIPVEPITFPAPAANVDVVITAPLRTVGWHSGVEIPTLVPAAPACATLAKRIKPLLHAEQVTQLPTKVVVSKLLVVAVAVHAAQLRTGFHVVDPTTVVAVPPQEIGVPELRV